MIGTDEQTLGARIAGIVHRRPCMGLAVDVAHRADRHDATIRGQGVRAVDCGRASVDCGHRHVPFADPWTRSEVCTILDGHHIRAHDSSHGHRN